MNNKLYILGIQIIIINLFLILFTLKGFRTIRYAAATSWSYPSYFFIFIYVYIINLSKNKLNYKKEMINYV
jgi:hypothetical protein